MNQRRKLFRCIERLQFVSYTRWLNAAGSLPFSSELSLNFKRTLKARNRRRDQGGEEQQMCLVSDLRGERCRRPEGKGGGPDRGQRLGTGEEEQTTSSNRWHRRRGECAVSALKSEEEDWLPWILHMSRWSRPLRAHHGLVLCVCVCLTHYLRLVRLKKKWWRGFRFLYTDDSFNVTVAVERTDPDRHVAKTNSSGWDAALMLFIFNMPRPKPKPLGDHALWDSGAFGRKSAF